MSEDKREAILARLVYVAGSIVDPKFVFRNQVDIPENARPAIVILDGDEDVDESSAGRGRPANGPAIVTMKPEFFLLLEAGAEKVGPALNLYRAKVIKAVTQDNSLIALCLNGDIRYEGFATGLGIGRSMEGESGFGFSFRYILRPDKL